MPIKFTPICKHCGGAISQEDYFAGWFHVEHRDQWDHVATPIIEVVPRAVQG